MKIALTVLGTGVLVYWQGVGVIFPVTALAGLYLGWRITRRLYANRS